ncbi:hypothetical protein ACFLYH_01955 [Candidatus Dependentiae bacterium]
MRDLNCTKFVLFVIVLFSICMLNGMDYHNYGGGCAPSSSYSTGLDCQQAAPPFEDSGRPPAENPYFYGPKDTKIEKYGYNNKKEIFKITNSEEIEGQISLFLDTIESYDQLDCLKKIGVGERCIRTIKSAIFNKSTLIKNKYVDKGKEKTNVINKIYRAFQGTYRYISTYREKINNYATSFLVKKNRSKKYITESFIEKLNPDEQNKQIKFTESDKQFIIKIIMNTSKSDFDSVSKNIKKRILFRKSLIEKLKIERKHCFEEMCKLLREEYSFNKDSLNDICFEFAGTILQCKKENLDMILDLPDKKENLDVNLAVILMSIILKMYPHKLLK